MDVRNRDARIVQDKMMNQVDQESTDRSPSGTESELVGHASLNPVSAAVNRIRSHETHIILESLIRIMKHH